MSKSFDKHQFINRDLSLLKFNHRVMLQSLNNNYPLLERLRFLLIFSRNIDEFFEVRVAKLKYQIATNRQSFGPDGIAPSQLLRKIAVESNQLIEQQYEILNDILLPELALQGIEFVPREAWSESQKTWLEEYFKNEVAPILSPIALDPAHPFPKLANKSLSFIVRLKGKDAFGRESRFAIVPAPRSLTRLIKLPKEISKNKDSFVFLSAIIHAHIEHLFNGMQATGCYQFRVTRNSDLYVDEKKTEDIADEVEGKLFNRIYGKEVRLEVAQDCPEEIRLFLLDEFGLEQEDLYLCNGPVNLGRIFSVFSQLDYPHLCFPKFSPEYPKEFIKSNNLFDLIRHKDYLMLHPFSSFIPVLDLLRQAATDPKVVSIKQTLYRVGHDSEIVEALDNAARNGKEVTVVIELKARFDEKENLVLASRLQEAGAVVCYGVVGYKTHAKMVLIQRKEHDEFKSYVHLGTGNYHVGNANIYTDYSLFTSEPSLCRDVQHIFQQLTGMGKTLPMEQIFNAPFTLKKQLIRLIDNEIEAATAGKPASIILKVNNLTEKSIIEKLYNASQNGVQIDLIVRSACCLIPGLKDVSENIRVKSVVGRFLEHFRAFYFENAENQVYCSSADLMSRNLNRRIEVCFPILSDRLAKRVVKDLKLYVKDLSQSWILNEDGSYSSPSHELNQKDVQKTILDKHCETAFVEYLD